MPELPEVESVIRSLNEVIHGQTIINIIVNYPSIIEKNGSIDDFKKQLINNHFLSVSRRGKFIIFKTDNVFLINHLRMEGKWYFEKNDTIFDQKHVLIRFILDDGNELRYHDTRRFGTFDFRNSNSLYITNPLQKLGLEPFDDKLTVEYLENIARGKNVAIKTFLLDQSYIAGIGNIYASEICHFSQIRPEKPAKLLSSDEWKRIIKGTHEILSAAIDMGGTTFSTFHSAKNVVGMYAEKLQVYARSGKPCYRCHSVIIKIQLNKRGTYFCGQCQYF